MEQRLFYTEPENTFTERRHLRGVKARVRATVLPEEQKTKVSNFLKSLILVIFPELNIEGDQ